MSQSAAKQKLPPVRDARMVEAKAEQAVPAGQAVRAAQAELAKQAAENPYAFFTFEEIGRLFGFSSVAVGHLSAAGAPVWFRRMNPAMLIRWMAEHPEAALQKRGTGGGMRNGECGTRNGESAGRAGGVSGSLTIR